MMLTDFFKSLFSQEGKRVLAVFKNGLKKAPAQIFFDNDDDLIEAATTYNALGKNVYHACATYTTSENRRGENVQAIKALWLDLDVGDGKPYSTQREAAQHFEEFRIALGLPKSHVVSSGGGIHEYLPFTMAITPEQWDQLADLFRTCLDHYGVKHDTSRTQDRASILRIPGTSNYKTDPAKAVTLKRMGVEVPASEIFAKLKTYADANGLLAGTKAAKSTKGRPKETNDLIGNRLDFPPSVGERIAERCPIIKEVAETGGDVRYEIWWRAMGVAKHTTDPQAVAARWTRNREATGHDKFDAQGVMGAWAYGPTTCQEFSKHSDKCHACDPLGAR